MKKSIYFLIVCIPLILDARVLVGFKPEEKSSEQKTVQEISHEDDEETVLEDEPTKQEDDARKKFLWQAAKMVGTGALFGLLAYNFFTTSQLSPTQSAAINQSSIQENSIFEDKKIGEAIAPSLNLDVNVVNTAENIKIFPDIKKELTPKEIARYQWLQKEFLAGAVMGFVGTTVTNVLVGSPHLALPITALQYAMSALFGAGALYYKKQLNPDFLKMPDRIDPVMFTLIP